MGVDCSENVDDSYDCTDFVQIFFTTKLTSSYNYIQLFKVYFKEMNLS